MSQIGYYRYKTLVENERVIAFFKSGIQSGLSTIKELPICDGGKIIKFLDSNGQYRFFTFNKFFESKDSPKLIGTTNEFITNILTDQTNSKNIGYKNERKLQLTSEATSEQLEFLSDIFTSVRVYLYIGTLQSDLSSDWLEVTIEGDNIVKRSKRNSGNFDITVTLPEHFTIKMI